MDQLIEWVFLFFLVLFLVLIVISFWTVPEGYEDEEGFHEGCQIKK